MLPTNLLLVVLLLLRMLLLLLLLRRRRRDGFQAVLPRSLPLREVHGDVVNQVQPVRQVARAVHLHSRAWRHAIPRLKVKPRGLVLPRLPREPHPVIVPLIEVHAPLRRPLRGTCHVAVVGLQDEDLVGGFVVGAQVLVAAKLVRS